MDRSRRCPAADAEALRVLNLATDMAMVERVRLHAERKTKALGVEEYKAGLCACREVEDTLEPLRRSYGATGLRRHEIEGDPISPLSGQAATVSRVQAHQRSGPLRLPITPTRGAPMTQRTGKQILRELSSVAERLKKKDEEASVLRQRRNQLVIEGRSDASDGPVKLKDLAAAAGLGTTFVARIEHAKGDDSKENAPKEKGKGTTTTK